MNEGKYNLLAAEVNQWLTKYTLTAIKVNYDIDSHANKRILQNLRQAIKLPNFNTYWHPSMNKQH